MKTKSTQKHEIPIIVGGKGWLVVEKPAGLSVHNEPGKDLRSLLAARISASRKLRDRIGISGEVGLHPVHRLDRDTSGVILLAHDPETLHHFAAQFESGSAAKRYTAILHGQASRPRGQDEWGLWKWPLTKGAGGRRDPRGKGPKKNCRTRYRILGASAHYSLVECELLTGRKHQIRRHAKLAGHPVVGDRRYGSKRAVTFLETNRGFKRLGLHASALTILPPGEINPMTVRSPELPHAMQRLFDMDGLPGE